MVSERRAVDELSTRNFWRLALTANYRVEGCHGTVRKERGVVGVLERRTVPFCAENEWCWGAVETLELQELDSQKARQRCTAAFLDGLAFVWRLPSQRLPSL